MSFPDEKAVYSYQDWQTWEGNWEWINGKAYSMSPAPTPLHQSVVGELHFALRAYFQRRSCQVFVAPFDVFLSESGDYRSPDHVVQPDLSVVCAKDQIGKKGCHGAPTLVIEVLSPSTALKDFNEKFELYQKYGVAEYWIVDPGNRAVHVFALADGEYKVKELYMDKGSVPSFVFEGFQVQLEELFRLEADA